MLDFLLDLLVNLHGLLFFLDNLLLYGRVDVRAATRPDNFFMVGLTPYKLVLMDILDIGIVILDVFEKPLNLFLCHVPKIPIVLRQQKLLHLIRLS